MATKINKTTNQNSNIQTGQLRGQLNNGIKTLNDMGLNDLTDVTITSPSENDVIFYDGNTWVNKDIADVMDAYVWVLDGGDADNEDEPVPPEPEFDTYAEELTYVLYNYINGEDFQNYIGTINGLDSIGMKGSTINLEISDKFNNITEEIFNDDNVSRMVGRIITVIYDNISADVRQIMDDVETDMWIAYKNAEENKQYNAKIFVYMSDSSVVFYDIVVLFNI